MSKSTDDAMIPPKRPRHGNEDNQDRLSDLPDCLLIHILSFLDSRYSVRTCVLSTRWNHLWKRVPALILHSAKFSSVKSFALFVSLILTLRHSSIPLHSLDFVRLGVVETQLLKIILSYVYSHNAHIHQLRIDVTADSIPILKCVSSCQSLTSLKLSVKHKNIGNGNYTESLFPNSWNLPLLTCLDLAYFVFSGGENGCAEPFSAFTKLNSLVINSYRVKDAQILSISSETLVNLTLSNNYDLKSPKIELSAPSLCTFTYIGRLDQKICGSSLSTVKHVNIDAPVFPRSSEYALVLLRELANVESLRFTSISLQIISLLPDLLEVKLPSLLKLKSLEVELLPTYSGSLVHAREQAMLKKVAAKSHKEAAKLRKEFEAGLELPPIPDGIVDFLRQNSPLAQVNITTKSSCFNLKQVAESVKGMENVCYRSQFAVPATPTSASSAAPVSAATPASATPPCLFLCHAENMATKVDNNESMLWPDLVTKAFIEIMVDEVMKGNMPCAVFHPRTWTLMATRLNSITNCSYKEEQLKEKMHTLQAMFHEFYLLLQNTEFRWNAETNTVTASKEAWQKYLKTHDKASQFQNKGCDHYKLLEIIFNKNNETQVLHHSSTPQTDKENELNNQNLNIGSMNHVRVDTDSSTNDIQEVGCPERSGKRKIQVIDHTSRKESTSCQIGDTLAACAQACLKIVEATSLHVTPDSCSLTKCVVALEEIIDISDDTFGKALKMFKDPDWREMFMAMSNDRRRGWLCRL